LIVFVDTTVRSPFAKRLADPSARLEEPHAAVVVQPCHLGRHLALAWAVLVSRKRRGDRAVRAQVVADGVRVEAVVLTPARDLDHHIERGCRVVDDREADPAVVHPGRHV
jgi:hypothetical protein